MSVTVKLEGFKELEAQLEKLSRAAGKSALRRALKKSAEPMAAIASSSAPVGPTGNLAASIKYGTKLTKRQASLHRKMFRNDKASVEGFVGANDPAAVPQEFGTIFLPPQPFMRPAWDQDRGPMLERLKVELWSEISKAVGRAERSAARAAKG